ncbi:MAG: carboxypeptidase-like regulatory domain-containing protein, partial [Gemmataceae bacterium]
MLLILPSLLAALALGAAPPAAAGEAEMRIRVVGDGQRPLADARVYTSIWAGKAGGGHSYTTDADGVAVVRRPRAVQLMRVWVSKPGYAGLFRGWEEGTPPATFIFPLSKATTAGGRVVDARGRGVAGVRIEARCEIDRAEELPDGLRFNTTLAYGWGAAVTDADGRWSLTNVPVTATALSLLVNHPDYVSDVFYGDLQKAQRVTLAQLRAGAALIRLEPGARIEGTVTDAAGRPVPKAVVVFHDAPYGMPGDWEVLTDEYGKYRLPTLKPGRHPITVVAVGHMPQRREVEAAAGPRREDFRLEPGKRLRVRVTDEDGKPVRASFSIDFWRGTKSLYTTRHPDVLPTHIPDRTNAEGLYEWSWAPADAVKYHVLAEGFLRNTFTLTAGDGVQTVTLRRVRTVAGRVTDAKTGKPVERFRVHPVLEFGPNNLYVERRHPVPGAAGAYRIALDRADVDYRLMVEAAGYRTA